MSRRPWIYRPQSVRIPEDAGVKRDVAVNRMTGVQAEQRLDALSRSQYDADTLFYDMFFASGALICIGPPFVNLGPPKAIFCDGERLRFKNEKEARLAKHIRLRIEIPAQKRRRERLDLRFCFSDFEVPASRDMQRARPPSLPRRNLCLVTVQKENPAQWIRDWLLWHYRAHGVQRAVIYDNGSRDFPELGGAFSDLAADLDIGLVHWPFPYGPFNSYHNQFAQAGALNHFFMFFGGSFNWGVNLDMDEYLFVERGPLLAERLRRLQRRRQPLMYLGERRFPRESVREERMPRFFHYRMRYCEKHYAFFRAPKCIFQPHQPQFYTAHEVFFRNELSLREIGERLWHILKLRVFRGKASGGWPLFRCLLYIFNSRFSARLEKYKQTDCFYSHYRGLNIGWKLTGKRKGPYPGLGSEISEIPPEFLTEDRRMAERAAELGFRDADEGTADASESPVPAQGA